jgi:hypothetical protein
MAPMLQCNIDARPVRHPGSKGPELPVRRRVM